jgi:hypothetical protein
LKAPIRRGTDAQQGTILLSGCSKKDPRIRQIEAAESRRTWVRGHWAYLAGRGCAKSLI